MGHVKYRVTEQIKVKVWWYYFELLIYSPSKIVMRIWFRDINTYFLRVPSVIKLRNVDSNQLVRKLTCLLFLLRPRLGYQPIYLLLVTPTTEKLLHLLTYSTTYREMNWKSAGSLVHITAWQYFISNKHLDNGMHMGCNSGGPVTQKHQDIMLLGSCYCIVGLGIHCCVKWNISADQNAWRFCFCLRAPLNTLFTRWFYFDYILVLGRCLGVNWSFCAS